MLLQRTVLFVYRYIIPLVLSGAALLRCSYASIFYLVGFIAVVLIQPSEYRRHQKIYAMIVLLSLWVWSLLILLTQAILWCLYLLELFPLDGIWGHLVHETIGFYWEDASVVQIIQMILPDCVVFLTCYTTFVFFHKCALKTPVLFGEDLKAEEIQTSFTQSTRRELLNLLDRQQALVRYLSGYTQLFLCFAAGVIYPSALSCTYLIGSFISMACLASGVSIYWLEALTWRGVMLFSTLNLFYLYLCQFQFGMVNLSIYWITGISGGELWVGSPFSEVWYVLAEFVVLVILMLAVSARIRLILALRAKYKIISCIPIEDSEPQLYQNAKNKLSTAREYEPEHLSELTHFITKWGLTIAVLGYLISCIVTPSIIQAGLLMMVMYGTSLLDQHRLRKLMPVILIYSSLFVMMQAVYNVPFEKPVTETLINVGFILFKTRYILFLGIQCIPNILLALYWRYSTYFIELKTDSSDRELDSFVSEMDLKSSTESIPPLQSKARRLYEKIKNIFEIAFQIFFIQSYSLSLLALLLCSLLSVNLFNFGYLCFFVVFMSRRIAFLCWIV